MVGIFHCIEVVEIAEEFVEAVHAGQETVEVAEVGFSELTDERMILLLSLREADIPSRHSPEDTRKVGGNSAPRGASCRLSSGRGSTAR